MRRHYPIPMNGNTQQQQQEPKQKENDKKEMDEKHQQQQHQYFQPPSSPIVATVLPFPNQTKNTIAARKRRILRGRIYLGIVICLFVQAILLPWYFFMRGSSSTLSSSSSTTLHQQSPIISSYSSSSSSSIFQPQFSQLSPDGSLNTFPIYLQQQQLQQTTTINNNNNNNRNFHSNLHCIGETHDETTAWMYRSCQFQNLCINVQTKEFVLFQKQQIQQSQIIQQQHLYSGITIPNAFISTDININNNNNKPTNFTLALGGINPRWKGKDFNQGIHKVQWFPKVLPSPSVSSTTTTTTTSTNIYMLDSNVIMIPFHSFAAHNVGHLLWDDFLPIFTLMQLFLDTELVMNNNNNNNIGDGRRFKILLIRVDTLPLLYGTCEMRRNKLQKCAQNFQKFLPLMGIDPTTFTTLKQLQFQTKELQQNDNINNINNNNNSSTSTFVCAKHALAGIGMLTDHGLKDHGWQPEKERYSNVQNVAKGALLYQFRNFMLQNLGLPIVPPSSSSPLQANIDNTHHHQKVIRILFSSHSSRDGPRDVSFEAQQGALERTFSSFNNNNNNNNDDNNQDFQLFISNIELATISNDIREQIELVSQRTDIFITTCGGGAMTATFLPRGASLIMYYPQTGGFDFEHFNFTGGPAYLDWDLFNNAAYLNVHWLPIETMNTQEGLQSLIYLVHHEIENKMQ